MDNEVRRLCRLTSEGEVEAFTDLVRYLIRKSYLPIEGKGGWVIKDEINKCFWNGSKWVDVPFIYLSSNDARESADKLSYFLGEKYETYIYRILCVFVDKELVKSSDHLLQKSIEEKKKRPIPERRVVGPARFPRTNITLEFEDEEEEV